MRAELSSVVLEHERYRTNAPRNAMTVDVEEHFQVAAFEGQIARKSWDGHDSRVVGNTSRVLDLFADAGVRGTFFVLGWVAERHPELVRRIVGAGTRAREPRLRPHTGFHPELTGRENFYLNGAMLGFTREEMNAKFKEIVDFAELWDFIDAPMRTYSTGMWARLGFATATDTQPDVLIVDEVLAVGDEAFQRKCFERIMQFRENGATILLVSHNLDMVEALCHRVAWIDQGHLKGLDEARVVVNDYRKFSRINEVNSSLL